MILPNFIESAVIYAFVGAFAGFMSGVLGIGGGIIIVPALAYIFSHHPDLPANMTMHYAAGTSLAIMIVNSQLAIRAHHQRKNILWTTYQRLWPGIVFGTVAGAWLADSLPSSVLKMIFGLFLFLLCLKMLFDGKGMKAVKIPGKWLNGLATFIIGLQSGLLGIGGGTLTIPYLSYCGINIRQIAALSALCTMTVAVVGTLSYIFTGIDQLSPVPWSTGYIFWPAVFWVALPAVFFAPLGVSMTYRLPEQHIKNGFIAFLLIISMDMLF
jgi:uncharacterized membrane protein YfcA